MPRIAGLFICILAASVFWYGCSGAPSAGPTAEGLAALLDAEPADPSGVVELKSSIITGLAAMDGSTAIVGKVLSGQDWDIDKATFMVRELPSDDEAAHDHGDGDHSECAFCQAKEGKDMASMALVRIVNEAGEVLPIDARKLLGLQENDIIVAQGSGSIDDDGTLSFTTSKLFIRR